MTNIKLVEKKEKDIIPNRNYVMVFLPIILLLILIGSIYMYNTNTSKIKRYLTNEDYECNKIECTKEINTEQYIIDVNNLDLTIANDQHIIKIKSDEITLQRRVDKKTCAYTSKQYSVTKLIDETYSYTVYCKEYVSEINNILNDYHKILEESNVNISKKELK